MLLEWSHQILKSSESPMRNKPNHTELPYVVTLDELTVAENLNGEAAFLRDTRGIVTEKNDESQGSLSVLWEDAVRDCFGIFGTFFKSKSQTGVSATQALDFFRDELKSRFRLLDADIALLSQYSQFLATTLQHLLLTAHIKREGQWVQALSINKRTEGNIYRGGDGELYYEITFSDMQLLDVPGEGPVALPGKASIKFRFTPEGPKLVHVATSNSLLHSLLFNQRVEIDGDKRIGAEVEENTLALQGSRKQLPFVLTAEMLLQDTGNANRAMEPILSENGLFTNSETNLSQLREDAARDVEILGKSFRKEGLAGGEGVPVSFQEYLRSLKLSYTEIALLNRYHQSLLAFLNFVFSEGARVISVDTGEPVDVLKLKFEKQPNIYRGDDGELYLEVYYSDMALLEAPEVKPVVLPGRAMAKFRFTASGPELVHVATSNSLLSSLFFSSHDVLVDPDAIAKAEEEERAIGENTAFVEERINASYDAKMTAKIDAWENGPITSEQDQQRRERYVDALEQEHRRERVQKAGAKFLTFWGNAQTAFPSDETKKLFQNFRSLTFDLEQQEKITDSQWQYFLRLCDEAKQEYDTFVENHHSTSSWDPKENDLSSFIGQLKREEKTYHAPTEAYRLAVGEAWKQGLSEEQQAYVLSVVVNNEWLNVKAGHSRAFTTADMLNDGEGFQAAEAYITEQCRLNPSLILLLTKNTYLTDANSEFWYQACQPIASCVYPALDKLDNVFNHYKAHCFEWTREARQERVSEMLLIVGECLRDPNLVPKEIREKILPKLERQFAQELDYLQEVAQLRAVNPLLAVEVWDAPTAVVVLADNANDQVKLQRRIGIALKASGKQRDESREATIERQAEWVAECDKRLAAVEEAIRGLADKEGVNGYLGDVHDVYPIWKEESGSWELNLKKALRHTKNRNPEKIYTCYLALEIIHKFNQTHGPDVENRDLSHIGDYQAVLDVLHNLLERNNKARRRGQGNRLGDQLRKALGWRTADSRNNTVRFSRKLGQSLTDLEARLFEVRKRYGRRSSSDCKTVFKDKVIPVAQLGDALVLEAFDRMQKADNIGLVVEIFQQYVEEVSPPRRLPTSVVSTHLSPDQKKQVMTQLEFIFTTQKKKLDLIQQVRLAPSQAELARLSSSGIAKTRSDLHFSGIELAAPVGLRVVSSEEERAIKFRKWILDDFEKTVTPAVRRAELERVKEFRKKKDAYRKSLEETCNDAAAVISGGDDVQKIVTEVDTAISEISASECDEDCDFQDAADVRKELTSLLETPKNEKLTMLLKQGLQMQVDSLRIGISGERDLVELSDTQKQFLEAFRDLSDNSGLTPAEAEVIVQPYREELAKAFEDHTVEFRVEPLIAARLQYWTQQIETAPIALLSALLQTASNETNTVLSAQKETIKTSQLKKGAIGSLESQVDNKRAPSVFQEYIEKRLERQKKETKEREEADAAAMIQQQQAEVLKIPPPSTEETDSSSSGSSDDEFADDRGELATVVDKQNMEEVVVSQNSPHRWFGSGKGRLRQKPVSQPVSQPAPSVIDEYTY